MGQLNEVPGVWKCLGEFLEKAVRVVEKIVGIGSTDPNPNECSDKAHPERPEQPAPGTPGGPGGPPIQR